MTVIPLGRCFGGAPPALPALGAVALPARHAAALGMLLPLLG